MRRKKPTVRQLRAANYLNLLEALSRLQLPAVCSEREDIDCILALRSASLVEALTEPPVVLRTGERFIPRAIVTGITPEGRLALMRGRRGMPHEIPLNPERRSAGSAG
ncbi:hypothetical protein [uncultured Variovorax sp.]|uniref:hypothetical protein n=1 Tax=uncultured Variovorax sp. TaxID=114708 RepID=UPI0025E2C198|nr:hypothetical protein [uncultured Variovorax sp.]